VDSLDEPDWSNVIALLQANFTTAAALENKPIPDDLPPMKQRVMNLLEQHGFSDKRSRKLDLDDFLRLLSVFNEEGIHFC